MKNYDQQIYYEMSGLDVFDNKVIEKPGRFDGTRARWKHWATRTRGFIRGVSLKLAGMMRIATEQKEPLTHHGWNEDEANLDAKLYSILSGLLDGEAMDVFCNVEEGHGLECWRQLSRDHEPKSVGHHRTRLMNILDPQLDQNLTFLQKIARWERLVREHVAMQPH